MSVWQKDKSVTDRFGVQFPASFLDGEPILSVTIDTSSNPTIIVSDETIDGDLYTCLLTGGDVGMTTISITANTPTRSSHQCITLWVREC